VAPDHGVRSAQVFAAQALNQAGNTLVGEVIGAPVAVEDEVTHEVGMRRQAGAEPDLQPALGQDVGRGQVLPEPERALVTDRDHRGAELDVTGALGSGREEDGRGRYAVLQVPLPDPRAVETQTLAELEEPQGVLQTRRRIVVREIPGRQEGQ